jgi:hypothetical protein
MSDPIKRYKIDVTHRDCRQPCCDAMPVDHPSTEGEWVLFDDHTRVVAEHEAAAFNRGVEAMRTAIIAGIANTLTKAQSVECIKTIIITDPGATA